MWFANILPFIRLPFHFVDGFLHCAKAYKFVLVFCFFFLFSHCTARGSGYPYMYTLQLHFFPHPLFCCNMSIQTTQLLKSVHLRGFARFGKYQFFFFWFKILFIFHRKISLYFIFIFLHNFLFSHCTARGLGYPYMYTLQLHFFPHPLFCCNMSIQTYFSMLFSRISL